jgi:hypothetical protein
LKGPRTSSGRRSFHGFGRLSLLEVCKLFGFDFYAFVKKLRLLPFLPLSFPALGNEDVHVGSRYILFKLPFLELVLPFSLTKFWTLTDRELDRNQRRLTSL